ncbi:MAG: GlxA family transcriptional regulator [Caulobacterales bacterium]|uniref:GlxA family transcriptional regulator n=1 Tax=Glycocaulis sp. TaxID=1969725 RepID=UPI003FA00571
MRPPSPAVSGKNAIRGNDTPRLILLMAYDGAQLLSLTGPCEAFSAANKAIEGEGGPPAYAIAAASVRGGNIQSAAGLVINTRPFGDFAGVRPDTIVIPGGSGIRPVMADKASLAWLREAAVSARRLVAFGGGAFILAAAGLLGGHRCVTHWRFEEDFEREFPEVRLQRGALYVRDGRISSAAGASASLDLAIDMVEEDAGHAIAAKVAHMLVVPRLRPGEQPQISAELAAQSAEQPRIVQAAEWIARHIDTCPPVGDLARQFAMSERNFSRRFRQETGLSPARFIEQTRLETARRWLVSSTASLESVARRSGFSSAGHLSQVFRKTMGVTPLAYRKAARQDGPTSPEDLPPSAKK